MYSKNPSPLLVHEGVVGGHEHMLRVSCSVTEEHIKSFPIAFTCLLSKRAPSVDDLVSRTRLGRKAQRRSVRRAREEQRRALEELNSLVPWKFDGVCFKRNSRRPTKHHFTSCSRFAEPLLKGAE